jgi:glyoxylase-like metal-dependent hydrolase (beta-lactamase superfamily II)
MMGPGVGVAPGSEESMAEFHVLVAGYLRDDEDRVGSTVSAVLDAASVVVIDPGLVRHVRAILDPLAELGPSPEDVTDVVISHHHPDHTLKAALFPNARVHDHWAWYRDDLWTSRTAEGFEVSPSVTLWETPGHTPQDVTTIVRADLGIVACTHLWWSSSGPPEDPLATDADALHANRRRVLSMPGLALVVPGHGEAFVPDDSTPR